VKTAITTAGAEAGSQPLASAPAPQPEALDVPQLVKSMMFHDAALGANSTQTPNRYQSFIDLSRLLAGDQAILLARAPKTVGSSWITDKGSLATNQDRRWVYYRFIIPLKKQ
jgi:hypothetical protein